MDEKIEVVEKQPEEIEEKQEEVSGEELKEVVEKKKRTPEEELTYFEGRAKRLRKDLGLESPEKIVEKPKTPTGELDETTLDYLDLKGITETEDIKEIEKVIAKTGMTARQALKDEYVISKLKSNKETREAKAAVPSNTKRSGSSASDNLELAIAKYERTGELPKDFALRSAVINAKVEQENTNKPFWH